MQRVKIFVKNFFHLPSFRLPLIVMVSLIISGMNFLFSDFSWMIIFKNFLFTFLLWQGNYSFSSVCHPFNQDHLQPRITIYLLFALLYSIFITALVNVALWQVDLLFRRYLAEFFISFGVTIFISLIYFSVEYFQLFRKSVEEREALKRAHIENELKVLNHQINPHFLFNSLNTLMSVIPEDSNLALEFTRRFSDVYRYVLQSKNKDLVSLAEEMQFVNSYIFLMKIRHGDNLKTEVSIPDQYLMSKVPPLTIQMICENAVKHNTISNAHPLRLTIRIKGELIKIWNNKNKKLVKEDGTGTGLENIEKRYRYLAEKSVEIIDAPDYFEVQLPLLKVERYEISDR
ncbi:MAG: sensor histidine kinase [Cyclobacteriaceae bacterium]